MTQFIPCCWEATFTFLWDMQLYFRQNILTWAKSGENPQHSQIFGDQGIFKYGIPNGIFSNQQANGFVYYMSQICLVIKTPKLYLLSTFDWLANFFMAWSKKSSKDPQIKGRLKSLRSSLCQAVWAPLPTAGTASAAHLDSAWRRAVRTRVGGISICSGSDTSWKLQALAAATFHLAVWQGLTHSDANVFIVVLILVLKVILDLKISFSLKIVPSETQARTPHCELMLYWKLWLNFRRWTEPQPAMGMALAAGKLGFTERFGICQQRSLYYYSLVLRRNSDKPLCILIAFRMNNPLIHLATLSSCFLVCKMRRKIMPTSQDNGEDGMKSWGWRAFFDC